MTNEFWKTLEKAAAAEARAEKVNFINLTTDVQDAEAQKRAVDNAITQKVDGLIIGATDTRGWDDTLAKAKAAGIPGIAVDSAIENDYISSLIQTDNLAAAGLAGDYLCQILGGKGKALVLGGTVGHQTGDARKNGVEEKLKACGVTVIGDYSDWDTNKSADLAQNTLTANPDLSAIFVAFDPGAAAAAAIVAQKGLAGQVPVVGFDALPIALKAIKDGEMAATVRQDPARMGKEGVDLILKLLKGEKVETEDHDPRRPHHQGQCGRVLAEVKGPRVDKETSRQGYRSPSRKHKRGESGAGAQGDCREFQRTHDARFEPGKA